MKIAIKNPAPLGKNLAKWGDYHFGLALQSALEAAGATVVMHFWPEWQRDEGEDVVLVLRGKQRYEPVQGKVHLLWVMSHPSTVATDEIDSYDLVYVAEDAQISYPVVRVASPPDWQYHTVLLGLRRAMELVLTGDQIYADEVPTVLITSINALGRTL